MNPIHPELQEMAKKFPRMPVNRWTLRFLRLILYFMPTQKPAGDIEISSTAVQHTESRHPVPLRVYQRKSMTSAVPALLWIHGGGLVIGTPKLDDAFMSKLVETLGIVVVSVDYRLAPDHPYPAAIEDCYAALKWIHTHAPTFGIDPNRIAIGGASAGGGLAASLAQMAYDRGEIRVVFQLLVYPMLDDRSSLRNDHPHLSLLTWTPDNNRFGWEAYLRQAVGLDNVPAYAVPARREDLNGLPPAWIGVGSLDLFYEEDAAYAERLKQCGVDCDLLVINGAFHGFDALGHDLPVIQAFRQAQIEILQRYLTY